MALGKRRAKQTPLWVGSTELPKAPGHRFYVKLNELLAEAGFDVFAEKACATYYEDAGSAGRPSVPPGTYFRMLLVGYFEGIESERGIAWRCSDSLSLRDFIGLLPSERVPDHSTLSKTRKRLGSEVFEGLFQFVLRVVERKGLLRGRVLGIDSTFLRADASMKSIVRRDTGEEYAEYLKRLAQAEGIEEPTAEDARRLDRKRKGKRTSNKEWQSPTDEDARIARLKDGRTRLAYKAEHVVDMETGAVVQAEIHTADQHDTQTMKPNLDAAREKIDRACDYDGDDDPPAGASPTAAGERAPRVVEVVADKGYHKVNLLLELQLAAYRTYIPERKQAVHRWGKEGHYVQQAFTGNHRRVARAKGKAHLRKRGELLERTFAHALDTGGMRRARLRGRENLRKRYLIHTAAMNLGLILRAALGSGTPRQAANARKGSALWIFVAWLTMVRLARALGASASIPGTTLRALTERISRSVHPPRLAA
jgi:transposase